MTAICGDSFESLVYEYLCGAVAAKTPAEAAVRKKRGKRQLRQMQ